MGRGARIVALAIATLLVLGVGAAAGAAPRVSSGPGNPTGTLNVAYDFASEFTNSFDPEQSTSECDTIITGQIYGFLTRRDAQNNVLPDLAQSWTIGQNSLTLDLRPGVRFSDGEPYDANAVKAGLLHNKPNEMYGALHAVTSIDVLDPLTVRINLSNNSGARLIYALSQGAGQIPAPNSLAQASTKPVGAGPFRFVSYSSGSGATLTRNKAFWDASGYKLGGLKFVQVGAGPPSVLALRSGSVDVTRFQPESYQTLKSDSSLGVASRPSLDYLQLQFRFTGPFANPLVRQAVSMSIDRATINKVALAGQGTVATQSFPPFSPDYVQGLASTYRFDPAAAKQLLAQAGYPNGFSFDMVIPGGGISLVERLGALIQNELAQAGITANIHRSLGSDLYTTYLLRKQGNALAAEQNDNPFPPIVLWGQFAADAFSAQQTNAVNPQINVLMQQAFNTADLNTINDLVRQASAVDVQQSLEVPIAFIPQQIAWSRSRVGGPVKAPLSTCSPDDLTGVYVKS